MKGTIVLCAIVTLAACNGSPTAPQPTPPPQPTQQTVSQPAPPAPDPEPAPAPEPPPAPPLPTPEPTPAPLPAPAPTPTPAPLPEPPKPLTFAASVSFAHWMGATSLPDRFDVTVFPDSATLGNLRASVTLKQGEIVILSGDGFRFMNMGPINGQYQWTLDGAIGQAQGWMTVK